MLLVAHVVCTTTDPIFMTTPEQMYLRRMYGMVDPPTPQHLQQQQVVRHEGRMMRDASVLQDGSKLVAMAGYLTGLGTPGTDTAGTAVTMSAAPLHAPLPPANQVNVAELRRVMHHRELRHSETFRVILERCYRMIRSHAAARRYECAFQVPLFMPGHPIYDVVRCIEHIVKNLTTNGYAVMYVQPRTLLVSWSILRGKEQDAVITNILRLQNASIAHAQTQHDKLAADAVRRDKELEDKVRVGGGVAEPAASPSLETQDASAPGPPLPPATTPGPSARRVRTFKDIAQFKPSGKFSLHI